MQPEANENFLLSPIRTKRLSEQAVDQITSLIEEGRLAVGDKLPSERELTSQLDVSRASTREALRILESQGLIEVRPGKGAYVMETGTETDITIELLAWFKEHCDELLDILIVRELLEGYAAHEAAKASSQELISALREAVEEMRASVERNALVEATNADRKFHRLLYDASGNRFLQILGDGIVGAMFGPRYSLLRIPGWAQRSIADHREILEAIAAGDSKAAMEATYRHMSSAREGIEESNTSAKR